MPVAGQKEPAFVKFHLQLGVNAPALGEGYGGVAVLVIPHHTATQVKVTIENGIVVGNSQSGGGVEVVVNFVAHRHILSPLVLDDEMQGQIDSPLAVEEMVQVGRQPRREALGHWAAIPDVLAPVGPDVHIEPTAVGLQLETGLRVAHQLEFVVVERHGQSVTTVVQTTHLQPYLRRELYFGL